MRQKEKKNLKKEIEFKHQLMENEANEGYQGNQGMEL